MPDYDERITYDPNGNILTYKRNGTTQAGSNIDMDDLGYDYYTGTNKLKHVSDLPGNTSHYIEDIDNQSNPNNYTYDAIGNLTADNAEGITGIEWNVYGKISVIHKGSTIISYSYDATGNRISKTVGNKTTWYVRDATGDVMAVYEKGGDDNFGHLTLKELHMYGSSRLGIYNTTTDVEFGVTNEITNFERGDKFFELTNHLGNVLVTVSDKKIGVDVNSDGTIDYYTADVVSATDNYVFGMAMPGRNFQSDKYRYGFNGKEKDNEVAGVSNTINMGNRIYDARLGRFYSLDPKLTLFPFLSPYNFAANCPLYYVDPDGQVIKPYDENSGKEFGAFFKRVFSTDMASLLTEHLSMDGSHKPIDPKSFRKALKGLSREQKVIARAYYKTINSEKLVVGYLSTEGSKQIPTELLLSKKDYDRVNGLTMDELTAKHGGITSINDGSRPEAGTAIAAAIIINPNGDFSKIPIGVLNKKGYSGTMEKDESSPSGSSMKPNLAYDSDFDEIMVHELGHVLYSGGIISTGNSDVESIQMGNQYRAMKNKAPRSGDPDHNLLSKEPKDEPGSNNLKPTSPVTATPEELTKGE